MDISAQIKAVEGHSLFLGNLSFELFTNEKDPKNPKLSGRFLKQDGTPVSTFYIHGEAVVNFSHICDWGTFNLPEHGLDGDGNGQYGNPPLKTSRRKVFLQQPKGGTLEALKDDIIKAVKTFLVNKKNKKLVSKLLPSLAKKMDSDAYTTEEGEGFIKSYEEMNRDFFTTISERVYKELVSFSIVPTNNVFRKARDPENSVESYPEEKELWGVSFDTLGIDQKFMEENTYAKSTVIDIDENPIDPKAIRLLKENKIRTIPVILFLNMRGDIEFDSGKIGVKFYMNNCMVLHKNEDMMTQEYVENLKGDTAALKPGESAFGFLKRPQETQEETPEKKPKMEESSTEEEEGVGEF
jgi:hypothetical protein